MPSRMGSTGSTSGQPPPDKIASYRPIAASVAWTVAGESVGRDGSGIGIVRETEAKPGSKWPP